MPYKFRLTVHDGLDAVVKVAELPVKLGEAVLDEGLKEPDDAPDSEVTNWF